MKADESLEGMAAEPDNAELSPIEISDGAPVGTRLRLNIFRNWYNDDGTWRGSYMVNGGAITCRRDALALGRALTRMVHVAERELEELEQSYSPREVALILRDADGRKIPKEILADC